MSMALTETEASSWSIDLREADVWPGSCESAERITTIALDDLILGTSIRDADLCEARVDVLMADPARWTPILVSGSDRRVVDGRHRVVAAGRSGFKAIAATWFDGDADDAFVESVRVNLQHGMGLSQTERQDAVRRILCSHHDWADRRIGELCGVSPKTVAQIRTRIPESSLCGGSGRRGVRVGRDGRSRPLDAAAQRVKIVEAVKEHPNTSLRTIARCVGVSPETVRRVRASMGRTEPLDEVSPSIDVFKVIFGHTRKPAWQRDAAFTSLDEAAITADFLERTDVSDADLGVHADAVPLSRVYEVADEARRRAVFWSRLADCVEGRARRSRA